MKKVVVEDTGTAKYQRAELQLFSCSFGQRKQS